MGTLRSNFIAAEQALRDHSALPKRTRYHAAAQLRQSLRAAYVTVILLMPGLVLTNFVTWRALQGERAARMALERRVEVVQKAARMTPLRPEWIHLEKLGGATRIAGSASTAIGQEHKPATSVKSSLGEQFAKKLADPAARDALREQQKGTAIQLYGELLKRWHLSSAAAEPVMSALADHELRQLASALSPGGADNDPSSRANAADNDAVLGVLNSQQLDELRAYDSTLPDRQTLAPFLNQLELAQTPLPKDTAEQLITIMRDERVAVPQPTAPAAGQAPGTYAQEMDQWQADLDQRIRDHAEFVLSSVALAKLEAFQNAQRAATSVFASVTTTDSVIQSAPVSGPVQP